MRSKGVGALLLLLCTMYFIAYIDRVNIGMASTVFGPEFGLSKTQLGVAISAFGWSYLVFQILGGWLGDTIGARRTLTACGIIVGLATISIGFANGLLAIIVARVLLGLGEGAMFPVASRAIAQSLPRELHGRAQGVTHACARVANAATPTLIAGLMAWSSWRGSFFVVGAASVAWAVIWAVFYRDRPASSVAATDAPVGARAVVPWLPLIRRILPIAAVYFCYGWVFWLFLSWIPQYFMHSQKLDITRSAFFASGVFFAGVAGDLLGGFLSDALLKRTGSLLIARRYLIAAALFCALLSMLPLLVVTDTLAIALCLSGALFFCELIIGPIWSLPMDITPQFCSTATGLMSAGATIAGILSPIAAGMLIDATGNWTLPFLVAIGVLLAGTLLALRIRPEEGLVLARHPL